MTNPAKILKVKCVDCHHTLTLASSELEEFTEHEIKISNINQFYNKLNCTSCSGTALMIWDSNDRLLFDPDHISECIHCLLPIEFPRIQALPETNICADCARKAAAGIPAFHQPETIKFDSELVPPKFKKCPSCKKTTILRTNRRTKERFIGCSGFPKCRWTSSLLE